MKLTKDTLIEGKIVKKGAEIVLKESPSSIYTLNDATRELAKVLSRYPLNIKYNGDSIVFSTKQSKDLFGNDLSIQLRLTPTYNKYSVRKLQLSGYYLATDKDGYIVYDNQKVNKVYQDIGYNEGLSEPRLSGKDLDKLIDYFEDFWSK